MKKISNFTRNIFNKWICSLIGFLGLNVSCDAFQEAEYGCPSASYIFKGKVTDENGLPIDRADVSIRDLYGRIESAETDAQGEYTLEIKNQRTLNAPKLTFSAGGYEWKDTTLSAKNFIYKKDHTPWYEEENSWDNGTATIEVNIKLKRRQ